MKSFLNFIPSLNIKILIYSVFFLTGGIIIHFIVMLLNFFTFNFSIEKNPFFFFQNTLFSYKMIPMMIAYGVLSLIIYYLFEKIRINIIKAHKNEVVNESEITMLTTAQKITALIIDSLSGYNAQILEWVEIRNENGQASKKVEHASRNIAKKLQSLSELSYIFPYKKEASLDDFYKSLECLKGDLP